MKNSDTTKKIPLDRGKILKQLTDLRKITSFNDWKLEYDNELDALFFGKTKMPRNSFLFNINDELNLFLTPNSTVSGIFIEYFGHNYVEHNKKLKPTFQTIINSKDHEKKKLAEEVLEEKLLGQALGSIFNKKTLVTAI